jgi:glycosyltransferase involved in cell wall biosynthesis
LKKYESIKNIRILHQNNSGQSIARNWALEMADGIYLMFVDSDDILLDGAIERLLNIAYEYKCDIVEGDIYKFYDDNEIAENINLYEKDVVAITTYKDNPYYVLTCCGYPHSKIFCRELWNELRFPEGYIFEDTIIKFVARRICNKYAKINSHVYAYRYNFDSSTRTSFPQRKIDSIWVLPRVIEMCRLLGIPFDNTFYLLTLNHIGILSWICVHEFDINVISAVLFFGKNILINFKDCRPNYIPVPFKMLEKAILDYNVKNWILTSKTIIKYGMLKKWREIN